MNIEKMDDAIQAFCLSMSDKPCSECLIKTECDSCCGMFMGNPTVCEIAYKKLIEHKIDSVFSPYIEKTEEKLETDNVNHPHHYCREGGMECIEEMLLIFGDRAVMTYCLLNAWKYRYRAADKNGEEDLKKSDWYIKKYKELKDKVDNE